MLIKHLIIYIIKLPAWHTSCSCVLAVVCCILFDMAFYFSHNSCTDVAVNKWHPL